jgi:hypothetical protein
MDMALPTRLKLLLMKRHGRLLTGAAVAALLTLGGCSPGIHSRDDDEAHKPAYLPGPTGKNKEPNNVENALRSSPSADSSAERNMGNTDSTGNTSQGSDTGR